MPVDAAQTDFLLQRENRPQNTGKKNLDQEAFLKLLVAQIKNQNPLEPMKDVEFISQLTQFSNLEQVIKTNSKLDELSMASAAQLSSQAVNMVGRTVVVPGDRLTLPAEGDVELKIDVPSTIVGGELTITDDDGRMIRRIALSPSNPGVGAAVWDGRDSDGNRMEAGTYRVHGSGISPTGTEIELSILAPARVDAVVWQQGVPMLRVFDRLLPLATVREVWR
jgi:flagellar basal-body rod modification protein FlgD